MIKHKQGFSLIEIIIALGMLAFISVYALQVLVTAHGLNEKAEDLDQSVYQTNHLIQLFDATASKEAFLNHEDLIKAEHHKTHHQDILTLYYNDEWQGISALEAQEAAYEMTLVMEKLPAASQSPPFLYRLSMETVKKGNYLLETKKDPEIYQISTVRYLP